MQALTLSLRMLSKALCAIYVTLINPSKSRDRERTALDLKRVSQSGWSSDNGGWLENLCVPIDEISSASA